MKKIGTKIYYCLTSGNVIKIIGDCQGYVRETTFDEDYEIYSELKEREKSSIGLLIFEFGEYPKLSQGSTGVTVNIETKELIFSYEELPTPPQEPQEPTEIEKIKIEQEQQNKDILINMLATTEMYEINRSLNISTLESDSEVKTIKKAPTYIQSTYQRLYELGIKKLEEIPFEIRINLKAK
nr:MAG TPA: hypothetical protein [Caudoviricetes sp.]